MNDLNNDTGLNKGTKINTLLEALLYHEWMSTRKVAEKVGESMSTTSSLLTQLRKRGLIKSRLSETQPAQGQHIRLRNRAIVPHENLKKSGKRSNTPKKSGLAAIEDALRKSAEAHRELEQALAGIAQDLSAYEEIRRAVAR